MNRLRWVKTIRFFHEDEFRPQRNFIFLKLIPSNLLWACFPVNFDPDCHDPDLGNVRGLLLILESPVMYQRKQNQRIKITILGLNQIRVSHLVEALEM